jgi:6-phosphogluconate dehydrogenase
MMVGGNMEAWTRLKPILTAIAATHQGDPCVDLLGPDGAGHFVKTVHNGIEYAEMQALAEIYGMLRYGAAWTPREVGEMFADWNEGPLRSYLVEITATLLRHDDPKTGHPMVDVITDAAGQKGTGRWTIIEAAHLGQAANMIEAAVGARSWSSEKATRQTAEGILGGARGPITPGSATMAEAFTAVRILGYAQGFRILNAAAQEYNWPLDPARIAEIWRAGCIIRSAMLDDIAEAFRTDLPHGQLILSSPFAQMLARTVPALREVVAGAVTAGHPVPVLASGMAWYDSMRQGYGTANIIQAQRDVFGRHGFERLGEDGRHHGPWWD